MNITRKQTGNIIVLSLSGKVTIDVSGRLKEEVSSALGEGHKSIILEFGGVTYIDSAGLGEIVSCHTSASRQDASIKLANVGGRSKDLLVLTKLIMVFSVYDTETEAIASFAQAG